MIEAGVNEIVVDASKEESEDESDDEAQIQEQLLARHQNGGADDAHDDGQSVGAGVGTGTDGEDARMDEESGAQARAESVGAGGTPGPSAKGKERVTTAGAAIPKDLRGKGWEYILELRRKRKKRTVPLQGVEQDPLVDDTQRRTSISLAHLETRIKAAIALDSPAEYRGFLLQYSKRLGELGLRSKAEELVRELIGPVYQ